MESLKSQIKSNFESLSFNEALKANESLFTEYERVHGRRSLNAVIAYYRKKSEREEMEAAAEPVAEAIVPAEEESNSQVEADNEAESETEVKPESNAEVETEIEVETEAEPVEEDEKSEPAEKPQFHFSSRNTSRWSATTKLSEQSPCGSAQLVKATRSGMTQARLPRSTTSSLSVSPATSTSQRRDCPLVRSTVRLR